MTSHPPSVLFVCLANICRSPMAAALFRIQLKQRVKDWQSWQVDLAGTWTQDGYGASENSCQVVARRGVDISGHKSKIVTADLLFRFDLILTMEAGQKEALQIEFPEVADRVYMLSEMMGLRKAVNDPMGKPIEAYEATAELIDQMISRGMDRILELVGSRHAQQDDGVSQR